MSDVGRLPPSMRLFTKAQRDQLIANSRATQADENGNSGDPFPVVKLFLPGTGFTWLLTELDPDEELCFGLCDLGMGSPELGYVSLLEITECSAIPGVFVEADKSFKATKPLTAYAREAQNCGEVKA